MTSDGTVSVLHDVLRVYDHRFLEMDDPTRRRLMLGTRHVLGEGLSEPARAALPAAYRLRAFCIQHGLHAELERLIRDEVAGHREGAVVVGGRVYAVYPYLRGVPRQYADITAEVGVEHRLDAVSWTGGRLKLRGRAALQRVEVRAADIALVLRHRTTAAEHRVPAESTGGDFETAADPAALTPGRWDVHIAVSALGVTREAPLGPVRGPKLKTTALTAGLTHETTTARLTDQAHLTLEVSETRAPRRRLFRRRRR